jgi:hypothetical protein
MKSYLVTVPITSMTIYRVAADDEAAAVKLVQRFLVEGSLTRPDPSRSVELWDVQEVRQREPEEWPVEEYTGPPDEPKEDDGEPIPF